MFGAQSGNRGGTSTVLVWQMEIRSRSESDQIVIYKSRLLTPLVTPETVVVALLNIGPPLEHLSEYIAGEVGLIGIPVKPS